MNIVFMGTPSFAVPSLKALYEAGHKICLVLSQPDRPKGRGYHLSPTPVKQAAEELMLPVYQPETLKDGMAEEQIALCKPDLIVVVAYGKILPESILKIPPLGCVNLHGSLLPKYRGAAPIQWSVLRGEPFVGNTTLYMDKGMDTGDIIYMQGSVPPEGETSSQRYERLAREGAPLLVKTVEDIAKGIAPRTPQDPALATYAPPITKEMGLLDFSKSAAELRLQILGLSESPGAYTFWQGKRLKVYNCLQGEHDGLVISCGDGQKLTLTDVQPEGKKRMSGEDFVRGNR